LRIPERPAASKRNEERAINFKILSGAVALAVFVGCTATTPNLDSKFGHAVNAAKAQQTLDPEASQNTDRVTGLDGTPAKESIDRYHDTYKAPPPTFNVINVNPGGRGQ
jgi:hypothetical protein